MARRGGGAADLPTVRTCATTRVHMRLLLEDPEYAERRAAIETQAWRAARRRVPLRTDCTLIPVVVHVVYRTQAENISQAQIDSQIRVLNRDFRGTNEDIDTVPEPFQPLIGDGRIQFELASTDPDGNPTDGVTRTQTNVNGFTDDDAVKSSDSGGVDPWPTDQYLNIWVCRLAGGLLGYAQFPGGPAETDGVVITHTGFGTTGTAAAPFDRGRTATHEIGHWLNLIHIWGDVLGCNGSDFVDDTPNQERYNFGCPTFPSPSCDNGTNGDMFMNYMDYVDDGCMVMFTPGQVVRMHAALEGPRSGIGTQIPCTVKLKFADEPIKLKFRDDPIPTLKLLDDPGGKHKILDDPPGTLKFRDDPGTWKIHDDPGTLKHVDDVKTPGLDKPPGGDVWGPQIPQPPSASLGGQPTPAPGQPAPFILSTPHHSSAWQRSYPAAATREAYEERLAQYEHALQEYARAEAAGQLGETDRQSLRAIYQEYTQLAEEYRRLGGGQV